MNAQTKNILRGLIIALTVGSVACSQGFQSNSGGSSSKAASTSPASQVNMEQVRASTTAANTALTQAQALLGQIFTTNGTINYNVFLGGVDFGALSTSTQACVTAAFPTANPLALVLTAPGDIAAALTCVLNDVVTVAGIANTDLNNALTILNGALAQATAGSAEATEIQSMITEVQNLQSQYNAAMQAVAMQVGLANQFLATLPTMATGVCPIPGLSIICGAAVSGFLTPVEAEITNFQHQIAAL